MISCKYRMRFTLLLQILVLCIVPFSSYAKVQAKPAQTTEKKTSVTLKLSSIRVIETKEQGGEELCLNVLSYSSLGTSENHRIPAEDLCWKTKNLDKIKDLVIWKADIHNNEEIKLILSLMEQDFPPWDSDELIGGAQLVLSYNKAKFAQEWVVPVNEEEIDLEMKGKRSDGAQIFLFKGPSAVYEVTFAVEQK